MTPRSHTLGVPMALACIGRTRILQNEPAAVVLDGVSRTFGDLEALTDVSLRVETGSILGVIGPSGAGKTTAMRLMTGSLAPSAGTVQVLGEDPRHLRRRTREKIGYLPQQFTLYPYLTARENVGFVASIYGLLWFRHGRRVKEALKLVELWDVRNRLAARMSGGMQRRLELAAALVHDPALLLLDEPTAGLDPIGAAAFDHLIMALQRRLELTVFLITHDLDTLWAICDRVAVLADEKVVAVGTIEELLALDHPWIQEYFNGPRGRAASAALEGHKG